jgi:hypothetical protein
MSTIVKTSDLDDAIKKGEDKRPLRLPWESLKRRRRRRRDKRTRETCQRMLAGPPRRGVARVSKEPLNRQRYTATTARAMDLANREKGWIPMLMVAIKETRRLS